MKSVSTAFTAIRINYNGEEDAHLQILFYIMLYPLKFEFFFVEFQLLYIHNFITIRNKKPNRKTDFSS